MTLIERFQKLLEAERSRVICLEQLAFLSPNKELNRMLSTFRNDASTACEMLHSLILQREGTTTSEVTALAEEIMELSSMEEMIGFLIKDEQNVLRQIEEVPPEELNVAEMEFLKNLWHQHNRIINMCKMALGGGR